MNQALDWGLLGRNPIKGAKQPALKNKEIKSLTVKQINDLLDAVKDTRYEALHYLAVTTGLGQGELLGLNFDDIDFNNNLVKIQRQLQRISEQGLIFTEPKTQRVKRIIALGNVAIEKLNAQISIIVKGKLLAGERWQEDNLVFHSSIGTPHEPRNLYRHFQTILKKARISKKRFHDLRHTAAKMMFKEGVHPKIVQERLGHSSITITLDTYSHAIPSLQRNIAKRLDELFE
ncbi:MAG: site-specific integrase [Chloroflexi bacterium]|nr:site-specific integrase [Chloroflexota bacterium]